jgi:hypothetical protein
MQLTKRDPAFHSSESFPSPFREEDGQDTAEGTRDRAAANEGY